MKEPQNNQQPQYPYSQQPPQQYPYSQQQPPQQPYPYSQQPPQQYPPQYMPPQPEKKGSLKIWQVAAIMGGIIFFLIIIFVLVVQLAHPSQSNVKDYSAYAQYEVPVRQLEVDGDIVDLPQRMLDVNDLSYIAIEDFADVFDYTTETDAKNQQATVSMGSRSVTFTNGNIKANVMDGDKSTMVTMLDEPLMFENEGMYVPLRSMQEIFNFEQVDWDEANNTVIVLTGNKAN